MSSTAATSTPTDHAARNDARRRPGVQIAALVLIVLVAQAAGLVGIPFTARGTESWYGQLDRPWFDPPNWVFAPVWTFLYALIGVAGWRVWRTAASPSRTTALRWWTVQLALNALWTPLFFGAQMPELALGEILVLGASIVATVVAFRAVDRIAAWMLLPYLGWVLYATLLNGAIAVMN